MQIFHLNANMKKVLKASLLLSIALPSFSFCQTRAYEIFGTISGNYNSKIYLFFEGNFMQRDSLSSEIKNGKFYFKGKTRMPIQGRLHMDQQSYIQDVYIDNNITFIKCTNKINISNNGQDTLNILSVVKVTGSSADKIKSDFEAYINRLNNSGISEQQKKEAYYQKLSSFIKSHSKSRLSPYLLGKASNLSYTQVNNLNLLIDTSLHKSFEIKSVHNLLNRLDKSKNSAIGKLFKDFILKDSSGNEIDSKQFRGKYTLIVCWASWCKPCRAEHPELNGIYEMYKNKEFEMIGISFDKDKEKWTKAIIKDQLQWKQVIDPEVFEGELAKFYGIEAIPANYLLDKEGKLLGISLTPKEIETIIKKLL